MTSGLVQHRAYVLTCMTSWMCHIWGLNRSWHIWMSHVTYEWVASYIRILVSPFTCSNIRDPLVVKGLTYMWHVTICSYVKGHIFTYYFNMWSHVTYSCISESRHILVSPFTYEWVSSPTRTHRQYAECNVWVHAARIYIHTYVHIYLCTNMCINMCNYTNMYSYVCVYIYMWIYLWMYLHIYTYIYIYIHIYTYTHL